MENLITKTEDGKLVVSSRRVADDFKKRHSDVIEKIQTLIKTKKSVMSMFIESSYKAGTGKNYKEYLLTRDGFSLLVMGFNGREALEWKLKYIEAFNTMEKQLKEFQTPKLPQTYLEALKALVKSEEEKEKVKKELEEQNSFVNKISESNGSMLVREVAKLASKGNITIGEKALWNKLREWGYISRKSTEPMQSAINSGWFEVIERVVERDGKTFVYKTTKVTGKGQVHIIKKLSKESENKVKKIQK